MIEEEKLKNLVNLQNDYNNVKNSLKLKEDKFKEDNSLLFDTIKSLTDSIENLKDNIRLDGLDEYSETDNKKLTGGLSIRVNKDIVYDNDIALDWAMKHNMCLSLDKTKFKKIAKVQELDFVTIENKPIVCFPKEIVIENE